MNERATYDVEVFYDGECPLCLREVRMLERLDRGRGRIVFTDIAAPDFSAAAHGRTQAELMAEIHGRLPDGTWLIGVEVFRRLYAAVGLRAAVQLTRLPGVDWTLGKAYELFARNRLRLTGRCVDGVCEPDPA
jgi:predicted DCC family thiol-disulfide oxidoreductase YuxK